MRASFPANSTVAIPDTTMPEADLLQACLDELDGVDDFLDRRELAEKHAPVLLGRTGIASMLAARIARTADSERNAPLDLFGVLVERAQRDAEIASRTVSTAPSAANLFSPIRSATRATIAALFIADSSDPEISAVNPLPSREVDACPDPTALPLGPA